VAVDVAHGHLGRGGRRGQVRDLAGDAAGREPHGLDVALDGLLDALEREAQVLVDGPLLERAVLTIVNVIGQDTVDIARVGGSRQGSKFVLGHGIRV